LSENAEYDAAKDRQGFIEGRIQEIEGKSSAAQTIDPSEVDAAVGTQIRCDCRVTGMKILATL
jgi:transcription elongation factor GreA